MGLETCPCLKLPTDSAEEPKIVTGAIETGYLIANKADPIVLPASQGFPKTRAMLWDRLLALKLNRAPCPSYNGFTLETLWQDLTYKEKVKSIIGTIIRIYKKKLKKKHDITFT